jgi:hypothetical protein
MKPEAEGSLEVMEIDHNLHCIITGNKEIRCGANNSQS